MKNKIICIVGATASGKTGLSIELAKNINAEIISADSMQIYRDLNIGTAKVTKEEMQKIPHYMIDICNIEEKFSVADFKNMCYDKIDAILKKGKNVVIVGGTGLYFNSIIYDLKFNTEDINLDYRKELYSIFEKKGANYLHEILRKVDPSSASQIHPNNYKRVIRAIEIATNSEDLKSNHLINEKERLEKYEHPKYDFCIYCINYPREELYKRIEKRIDIMVKNGIVEEARKVYDLNLDKDCTCMQAIGYKEFFQYFEGKISLEKAVENLKKATRHYAKRQETWFKNKLKCEYLEEYNNTELMLKRIIEDSGILK